MEQNKTNRQQSGTAMGFLSGVLIGGVMGSSIALLQASRSGAETRRRLREKVDELQRKTEQMVTGAETRVEQVADQIAGRAEVLESRGKAIAGSAEKAINTAKEETKKAIQTVAGN